MARWIALLRGINVGGNNPLPMKDLSTLFADAGCKNVRTYIQSGNVVFDAEIDSGQAFANSIGDEVEARFGFRPAVLLLSASEFTRAKESNPYPEAETEPKFLHLLFLETEPAEGALAAASKLASTTERFELIGKALYLHAPNGIGRSKFVKQVDKALGVNATGRNWRTVSKLAEMAGTGA